MDPMYHPVVQLFVGEIEAKFVNRVDAGSGAGVVLRSREIKNGDEGAERILTELLVDMLV